jgi:hypothetical protein
MNAQTESYSTVTFTVFLCTMSKTAVYYNGSIVKYGQVYVSYRGQGNKFNEYQTNLT